MEPLPLVLKLLVFALVVQAKHDGQTPDDDDGGPSFTSSASAQPQSPAGTSTVLVTSTLTSAPGSTSSSTGSTGSTASASLAVPSGALSFTPPANVTTCEPAVFTWEFNSSASVPVAIVVTNERAVQNQVPNQAPLVERTISSNLDARTCVVSWPAADVPPGAYTLLANDASRTTSLSAQSPPFFVNTGQDTSCLSQNSTSSASTSGAAEPSSTDASSDDHTSDASDPPTDPKSMSTGAIVGTIAGIVVGVGGLLFVFSLPRLRHRVLRSRAPRRPGGPYMLF